jgi:tetratricopeptide (TPR) repeat protein
MVALFHGLMNTARSMPPEQAIPALSAFLDRYPDVSGARELLSRAQQLSGDPKAALETWHPLFEAHPDDPNAHARMGELALAMGDYVQAEFYLTAATERAPKLPMPHALLAELFRRQGDCPSALHHVEDGLQYAPQSTRLLLVRGACRNDTEDLLGAESDLRAVLQADPNNMDVRFLLAVNLSQQRRLDDAITLFEEQLRHTPGAILAHTGLGMALYETTQLERAIPHLRIAATNDPSGQALMLLADALLRSGGDLSEASSILKQAADLRPGDSQISAVRAQILLAQGDIDAALEETSRSRQYSPSANP